MPGSNPPDWKAVFSVIGIMLFLGVIGGKAATFGLWAGAIAIGVFILSYYGKGGFPQ
jgi:hypothetical protein